MASDRSVLERQIERVELRPFTLDGFHQRRERRQRNRRIGAGIVGVVVAGVVLGGLVRVISSEPLPTDELQTPFLGRWYSADIDGSNQTMDVRAVGERAVEIVVHDDSASVCSGVPATMTGTGGIGDDGALVIPSPVLTCDDGSEPEALSSSPLHEQLRDLTFVLDAEAETLTDSLGSVWERTRPEDPPAPQGMWPQSSLDEVREAQELADAGDPRSTWQVEPDIEGRIDDAEIFARFLREVFGWEDFQNVGADGVELGPDDTAFRVEGALFIRCAPGGTNPLYPEDPVGGGCAPTIDDHRYETVKLDVERPVRTGATGIWVVTSWGTAPSYEQFTPPSAADAEEVLGRFLQARVNGEGAEEYLESPDGDIPLLYATSAGSPYEGFELDLVDEPVWPSGSAEYTVRLFADGRATVVEQPFLVYPVAGGLELDYGSQTGRDLATFEGGEAVPVPYEFLDGDITFAAAPPWDYSWGGWDFSPTKTALILDNEHDERVALLVDPRPSGAGCGEGAAAADAAALVQSLRTDPDLEVTAPVSVRVGGVEAVRMDVVTTEEASVCPDVGQPQVFTDGWLEPGQRMRLYLLDLPGGSARILAIAVSAPGSRFEAVLEAAAPILDSIRFHTA